MPKWLQIAFEVSLINRYQRFTPGGICVSYRIKNISKGPSEGSIVIYEKVEQSNCLDSPLLKDVKEELPEARNSSYHKPQAPEEVVYITRATTDGQHHNHLGVHPELIRNVQQTLIWTSSWLTKIG